MGPNNLHFKYAVWGGRREEGSGWGTRVYLWQIHIDIGQNQYNIVKLKNKIKLKNFCIYKYKQHLCIIYFSIIVQFGFRTTLSIIS